MQLPSVLLAPLPGNCPPMSALCSGGGCIPPRPIRQDEEPGLLHMMDSMTMTFDVGLLSHLADPIPSGVSLLKGLLEGKACILLMMVGEGVHEHTGTDVYTGVNLGMCGCVGEH